MSRAMRAGCWFAGLAAVLRVLRSLGELLGGPPITSPGGAVRWIDREGPSTTAVWLVWHAAEVALWYLVVVSVLHAVGTATRWAGAARVADIVTSAGTARVVRVGLGAGLVATTTISPVPVGASPEPEEPGTAVMRPLERDARQAGAGAPAPPTATAEPHEPAPPEQIPVESDRYTVEPGDSLWLIAETLLEDAWQRPATDREIDPFWRALVAANRHRLVDSENADLILPGQVFEVPPIPARPA